MSRSSVFSLLLIILLVIGAVAGTIYLKRSNARTLDVDGYLHSPSDSAVAIPSVTPLDDPQLSPDDAAADAAAVIPDTLVGTDQRRVEDAGYEDGYWDGYDDAHKGEYHFSYNETSAFRSLAEQRQYGTCYREGYEEGWEAGQQHRANADARDEYSKMPPKE